MTLSEKKDGGDGSEGGTPVGEDERVKEECLYLWENEKENKWRGPLLTGQESESVRWYLCVREAYRVGGSCGVSKI